MATSKLDQWKDLHSHMHAKYGTASATLMNVTTMIPKGCVICHEALPDETGLLS